jgi:hypothetical protein
MLDCQGLSLNAVFGREVRIQMLKMAVLDRQEGVEKKNLRRPGAQQPMGDNGKVMWWPHITTAGRRQFAATGKQCQRRNIL